MFLCSFSPGPDPNWIILWAWDCSDSVAELWEVHGLARRTGRKQMPVWPSYYCAVWIYWLSKPFPGIEHFFKCAAKCTLFSNMSTWTSRIFFSVVVRSLGHSPRQKIPQFWINTLLFPLFTSLSLTEMQRHHPRMYVTNNKKSLYNTIFLEKQQLNPVKRINSTKILKAIIDIYYMICTYVYVWV